MDLNENVGFNEDIDFNEDVEFENMENITNQLMESMDVSMDTPSSLHNRSTSGLYQRNKLDSLGILPPTPQRSRRLDPAMRSRTGMIYDSHLDTYIPHYDREGRIRTPPPIVRPASAAYSPSRQTFDPRNALYEQTPPNRYYLESGPRKMPPRRLMFRKSDYDPEWEDSDEDEGAGMVEDEIEEAEVPEEEEEEEEYLMDEIRMAIQRANARQKERMDDSMLMRDIRRNLAVRRPQSPRVTAEDRNRGLMPPVYQTPPSQQQVFGNLSPVMLDMTPVRGRMYNNAVVSTPVHDYNTPPTQPLLCGVFKRHRPRWYKRFKNRF